MCSKMSQLHAELTEQAYDLGFGSIEEAEANGYEVDYNRRMLVDGRELAHEDWSRERKEVLEKLSELHSNYVEGDYKIKSERQIIEHAIEFIKKGEI